MRVVVENFNSNTVITSLFDNDDLTDTFTSEEIYIPYFKYTFTF